MLRVQVKETISKLNDAQILEYVLTGERLYDPEAVDFARQEMARRNLSSDQIADMRSPILEKLAEYDAKTPPNHRERVRETAILCQRCGFEAPNKYVQYTENVGLFIVRFRNHFAGHLCKKCNRRVYWRMTMVNVLLGWWGIVSLLMTPGILIDNLIWRLRTRSIPSSPPGSGPPELTDAAIASLNVHAVLINTRLDYGIEVSEIAWEVAPLAQVTPGQALLYARQVLASRIPIQQTPTYGFPVVQKAASG